MKKIIFTVIALVAFSGASLASNGKKIKKIVQRENCDTVWGRTKIYCVNQGMSDALANAIAFAAYDKCLGC